ncbi:MAG: AI-2E family transporter [Pseudomonadota bacterium]|nr:AI-2E family transporter [Pseudomonadota bacterium]
MQVREPINRALPVMVGVALTLGFLSWAQPVVVPVALAILFTFLLAPLSNWLERHRVPRAPASALVTLAALTLVVGVFYGVTRQISGLLDEYPKYEQNVTLKITQLRERGRTGLLDKVQIVSDRLSRQLEPKRPQDMSSGEREMAQAQPVRVVEEGAFSLSQLWSVAGPVLEPIALAGLVLVLVLFMLLNREDLRDRVISLVGVGQLADTTRALEEAGERVSRYLLLQLMINTGFGIAVAIGLWLIGIPYAPLWGFFAALLRYIPYLGPWLAALLPLLLSLLISREWSVALMVVALFGALELITNMLIEPMAYGRGIGVSQAALLVAVAFWTWLWGPVGLVLASPLTVCLVVLGRYVPFLKFLDTLLGDRPALAPSDRLYQRMLAQDEAESAELVNDLSALDGLDVVYDDVVVPMLAHARDDLRIGRLDKAIHDRLVSDASDLVDGHRRMIRPEAMVGGELMPVLGIPSRDELDEVALAMLGKLVDIGRVAWTSAGSNALSSEVVAKVQAHPYKVIVLMALPPGGLAHVRYLCRRLRAEGQALKILVVRPGLYADDTPRQRRELLDAGANQVVTSMKDAVSELNKLALLD